MLNIKINNEEMCCNNINEIKESILQPTNLILKNCYPMKWEENQDYVSRFFYPKLWSKCIISDKGDNKNVIGKNIYADDVKTDYKSNIEVLGETKQETTTGKNVFDNTAKYIETNAEGTWTITPLPTGIELKTTALGPYPFIGIRLLDITNLVGKTLRTRVKINNGDYTRAVIMYAITDENNSWSKVIEKNDFVIPEIVGNNKYIELLLRINGDDGKPKSVKFEDFIITIDNADMTYEPYTGGIPSPNPEYPQEIESVKAYNLYNKATEIDNTYIDDKTGEAKSSGYYFASDYIEIKSNIKMLLTWESENLFNKIYYAFYDSNKKYVSGSNSGSLSSLKYEISVPKNVSYIRISMVKIVNEVPVKREKVQLVEGTEQKQYQPYGEISIKQTGKNLLNPNTDVKNGYWTQTPDNFQVGAIWYSFYKYLRKGTYTISVIPQQVDKDIVNKFERFWIDGKETPLFSTNVNQTTTITLKENGLFACNIVAKGKDYTKQPYIQLEEGTEPTPYEPYKENIYPIKLVDKQANKIGEAQDYIYCKNGKWYLHKETGEKIFNGTENWNWSGSTKKYWIDLECELVKKENDKSYCNYFRNIYRGWYDNSYGIFTDDNTYVGNDKMAMYFSAKEIVEDNNITEWKNWLKDKYNQGEPVKVQYILKAPQEIELNECDFKLFEGVNNLELISNGLGNIDLTYNIEKIIFAGAVKNTGNISLNPRMPKYANIEVIDFKSLLSEGDTLDFVITNLTIPEAINKVVDNIKEYGFIVGNINIKDTTTIIGAYNTQNQTAYDVLQYLSDISNSVWITRLVDENTIAIDFYDTDLLPKKAPIDYTEKYFCENNIRDLEYNLNSRDYRNKQVIISDKIISSVITEETIILDGYNQKISLENRIGKMVEIFVNGEPKTIITNAEKTYGLTADFYYTPSSNIVEFERIYNPGTKVKINYKAIINGRQVAEDKTEIDFVNQSINRKGNISRYEVRNDIENSEQLLKIAETYLNQKGKEQITLKLKSKNDLFNCGDAVDFLNAPINELKTKFMVKNKTTKIIGNNADILYSYELVNNYNKENSINYFDNQRRKVAGNIEEDKVIVRNIDLENNINIIFKNIKIEEISSSGDNILNCELNAPFVV